MAVQNLPDGLLLGQDEPPLGRGFIDGNHQHHQIPRSQQIGHNGIPGLCRREAFGQPLFQRMDARAGFGRNREDIRRFSDKPQAPGRCFIDFITHDYIGDSLFLDALQHGGILFCKSLGSVDHQNRNIRLVQHLIAALDAKGAQLPLVVDARGVDDHHRPQGQKLHGLFHRICGRPLNIRNDGEVLPSQGVDDAGFSGVAPAKHADMHAVGRWCVV